MNRVQAGTILKGAGADGADAAAQGHTAQTRTLLKGRLADAGHCVTQVDLLQIGATVEGAVADFRNRDGNDNVLQTRAVCEGKMPDFIDRVNRVANLDGLGDDNALAAALVSAQAGRPLAVVDEVHAVDRGEVLINGDDL